MPSMKRFFLFSKKKNQGPKFHEFHGYDGLRPSAYSVSPHYSNQYNPAHFPAGPPPHSLSHRQHQQQQQQQLYPAHQVLPQPQPQPQLVPSGQCPCPQCFYQQTSISHTYGVQQQQSHQIQQQQQILFNQHNQQQQQQQQQAPPLLPHQQTQMAQQLQQQLQHHPHQIPAQSPPQHQQVCQQHQLQPLVHHQQQPQNPFQTSPMHHHHQQTQQHFVSQTSAQTPAPPQIVTAAVSAQSCICQHCPLQHQQQQHQLSTLMGQPMQLNANHIVQANGNCQHQQIESQEPNQQVVSPFHLSQQHNTLGSMVQHQAAQQQSYQTQSNQTINHNASVTQSMAPVAVHTLAPSQQPQQFQCHTIQPQQYQQQKHQLQLQQQQQHHLRVQSLHQQSAAPFQSSHPQLEQTIAQSQHYLRNHSDPTHVDCQTEPHESSGYANVKMMQMNSYPTKQLESPHSLYVNGHTDPGPQTTCAARRFKEPVYCNREPMLPEYKPPPDYETFMRAKMNYSKVENGNQHTMFNGDSTAWNQPEDSSYENFPPYPPYSNIDIARQEAAFIS